MTSCSLWTLLDSDACGRQNYQLALSATAQTATQPAAAPTSTSIAYYSTLQVPSSCCYTDSLFCTYGDATLSRRDLHPSLSRVLELSKSDSQGTASVTILAARSTY